MTAEMLWNKFYEEYDDPYSLIHEFLVERNISLDKEMFIKNIEKLPHSFLEKLEKNPKFLLTQLDVQGLILCKEII